MVVDGNFDAAEAHSFIVFQNNGKNYVYDPVNQMERKLPRIAVFTGNKEKDYLETKNLFGTDRWYYAGGSKGAFLKYFPDNNLKETLGKASQKNVHKKDKQNA